MSLQEPKRRRLSGNGSKGSASKAVEKSGDEEAVKAASASSSPPTELFKKEELQCVVCFEFPSGGSVYQCQAGHLLCQLCLHRVTESTKSICPSCRVRISRDRPTRNLFAERVLASVMVPCENANCPDSFQFSKIKAHQTKECPFRPATCKFAPIGCEWEGIHKELADHEESCELATKSAKSILKRVLKLNAAREAERQQLSQTVGSHQLVCETLSRRCRDVQFKDVTLHSGTLGAENVLCSNPFTALGITWEAHLDAVLPNSSGASAGSALPSQVGLVLRVVSRIKRKMTLRLIMLPGPESDSELPPSVHSIILKRNCMETELIPFPVSRDHGAALAQRDALNLRLGFVDTRVGAMARTFSATDEGGYSESDSSESEDEDPEDEDESGADEMAEYSDGVASDYVSDD